MILEGRRRAEQRPLIQPENGVTEAFWRELPSKWWAGQRKQVVVRSMAWEGHWNQGNGVLPCCSFLGRPKTWPAVEIHQVRGQLWVASVWENYSCAKPWTVVLASLVGWNYTYCLMSSIFYARWKLKVSTVSLICKAQDPSSGYLESSRFQIDPDSTQVCEPLKSQVSACRPQEKSWWAWFGPWGHRWLISDLDMSFVRPQILCLHLLFACLETSPSTPLLL